MRNNKRYLGIFGFVENYIFLKHWIIIYRQYYTIVTVSSLQKITISAVKPEAP